MHNKLDIKVPRHQVLHFFMAFSNVHSTWRQQWTKWRRFVPEVAPFCTENGAVLYRKWHICLKVKFSCVPFSPHLSAQWRFYSLRFKSSRKEKDIIFTTCRKVKTVCPFFPHPSDGLQTDQVIPSDQESEQGRIHGISRS